MQKHKHKILAALIALPAAILLWLYVVTVVSPNSTRTIYNVPVSFEGTIVLAERDLMLTTEGTSVNLEIRGDRVNLKKLSNENIRVIADVSKIAEAGDYSVSLTVSFPDIPGSGDFEIMHKSKTEVEVSVANVKTKTVPFSVDVGGSEAKDGFFFDNAGVSIEPAEVTVSGPDYEVDAVSEAVIDCSDINTLEETLIEERPIILRNHDGTEITASDYLTVSQHTATVTLPIQKYKELMVAVDIKNGGGATEENVESLTFSTDIIRVRGSASQIDKLEDTLVLGTIDLSKVSSSNDTKTFKVTLPSGIKNVSGINEVDVTVKLTGLRVLTISVNANQIELLNAPQNRRVTVNAQQISVKLRGLEQEIGAISDKDIKITLDLSNVTESGEVPATVTVNGYPNVGVLEDVFVDITIK